MSGQGNHHGYQDITLENNLQHKQMPVSPLQNPDHPQQKKTGQSVGKRLFKIFLVFLLLITFCVAMGFLSLYQYLGTRSINAHSFIPYIEKIINTQLNDAHISLRHVILRRDKNHPGIQVRMLGIKILQTDGKLVAEAPEAGFNFDIQALLRGEAAAEEIIFFAPQIALLYDEKHGLNFSFAMSKAASPLPEDLKIDTTSSDMRGAIDQGTAIIDEQAAVKKLASIFSSLHKYRKTTSILKKLRITDAQLYFSQGGLNSVWIIPSFTVDLAQKSDESDIVGSLSVLTNSRPLKVDFRVSQTNEEDSLELNISNFLPSYIFPKIGYSGTVGLMHVPVSGVTTFRLSKAGTLKSVNAIIKFSEGEVFFPGEKLEALKVRDSTIRVSYQSGSDEEIRISPSVLRWNGNEAVIQGRLIPEMQENGWEKGRYLISADNIRADAKLFNLPPLNIGAWMSKGTFDLKQHQIHLGEFLYRFGKSEISMSGDIFRTNKVPDIKLNGSLRHIPVGLVKRIWNNNVAPETLEWIGENIKTAVVSQGRFTVDIPHKAYDYLNIHKVMPEKSIDVKLIIRNISGQYADDIPMFFTDQANIHLTGQYFSLFAKNVKSTLSSKKEIKVSDFQFQVDQTQIGSDVEYGLYEFNVSAKNAALIEYLSLPALGVLNAEKYRKSNVKGKASGHFKMKIPFKERLTPEDFAVKGSMNLKNLSAKKIFGDFDLTKGNVKLSVTPDALAARGKIFINKVPADLTWQHIFKATADKQPPLRIVTTLTKKRQKRLGIDTGKILTGFIPVDLLIERLDRKNPIVKVHADITNAQFNLPSLFWTKLPGAPGQVQFEVVHKQKDSLHLKDVAIYGDDLDIRGDIYLDKNNKLTSFKFSRFNLNLLTDMSVSGKMRRSDNILLVDAKARSFDARPFFRRLFSTSRKKKISKRRNRSKQKTAIYGVNIHANIKTLVGYHEETANNVTLTMKKHGARLLALNSKGTLSREAPVTINMVIGQKNQRYLVSETTNTGAALKLIGFYSKMYGGQGSLQINLDAAGEAEETGNLWLKNFAVTGDDIMKEVLTSSPNSTRNRKNNKLDRQLQVMKTSIKFDKLKAQFSIKNGQMLLHEAYVNGPLLGATLRGKIDFRAKHIALGGTYVPLFGLNSPFLKAVPILGDILVGRNGEGIFGITYAIQGKMKNPTVFVNPLSLITPGIFRQIMEFQDPNMQTFSKKGQPTQKRQPQNRRRRRGRGQ